MSRRGKGLGGKWRWDAVGVGGKAELIDGSDLQELELEGLVGMLVRQ